MLAIEHLELRRKSFSFRANLSVAEESLNAVIGPSGGGKSTLLSLIAGFETADNGAVLWKGHDLTDRDPGDRPVASLFQDNNLFPHLDILTNVALGAAPVLRPSDDVKSQAQEALGRVGLGDLVARKPSELSGGQQSRAAIARLTLTNRPIVLMDEPFAALGPGQRQEMLVLVKDLLPHATILLVTHDPEDAKQCQDTILVVDGKVSEPQNTMTLFADPPAALRDYLS